MMTEIETIDGGQKMLSLGGQTLFKKNSSKFNLSKKLLYQKLPGYTAPRYLILI